MGVTHEKVDINLFGELESKNFDLNQMKLRK